MPTLPVELVPSPSGLYLVPWAPLTPAQCEHLAEQLLEHARQHRPTKA